MGPWSINGTESQYLGIYKVPNLGCFLDVIPMERLVWTSMLFPDYRPAVFDDIPITAIITMEREGNKTSGFYEGTKIAVDQLVEHVMAMK